MNKKIQTKFVIPEGMFKAAAEKMFELYQKASLEPETEMKTARELVTDVVGAVLNWQSENPVVPTDEQINDFYSGESEAGVSFDFLRRFSVWFQSHMLLASEEDNDELPDAIRHLYFGGLHEGSETTKLVRSRVLEAYRIGQKSK